MRVLLILSLVAGGLVHLLPLIGVLGNERLAQLYGVQVTGADLSLLLRHRAVLFGIIGLLMLCAVPIPAWRLPALMAGIVSILSFIVLAWSGGAINEALTRVLRVDLVLLPLLLLGLVGYFMTGRPASG